MAVVIKSKPARVILVRPNVVKVSPKIERVRVTTVGIQGPPGPVTVADATRLTAGETLGGQRVARREGALAFYASADNPAHAHQATGITKGAAVEGSPAEIQSLGEMTEPSWSWLPGPIFVGQNGQLTQTRPEAGFVLTVAVAVAPTTIMIRIGSPIFLIP